MNEHLGLLVGRARAWTHWGAHVVAVVGATDSISEQAFEGRGAGLDESAALGCSVTWAKERLVLPHIVGLDRQDDPVGEQATVTKNRPSPRAQIPGIGVFDRAGDVVGITVKPLE